MAPEKIIVVFGATGVQGGSVVQALLRDGKYAVRGVSRDSTKPAAKALSEQGVEMVSADLDDPKSLAQAMKGAYGAFGVTDFWIKLSEEVEITQGKNIGEAAKEAGIKHLIYSSLLNITELTKGELSGMHHFDSKAKVETYIRSIDVPSSFFLPGFYMSNLPGGMFRLDAESGTWTMALPVPDTTPIPLVAAEYDTGKYVVGMFNNPDKTLGKQVLGSTRYVTPKEIVETFQRVKPTAGKGAKYVELTEAMYKGALKAAGLPDIAVEDLYENMILMNREGYYGGRELDPDPEIVSEKLTSWEDYVSLAKSWKDLK